MNNSLPDIYPSGTTLTVGSHHARIQKYVTSGGFAHIYSVEISPPDPNSASNLACLKRVLVPDKPSLNVLRAEVDAMKLLRGNKHVVSYIDSHAAKTASPHGSYEVFLLMEYCTSGGLIDFMNTRLQHRLTEAEVLKIMSDIVQGIAAMHALLPPLIHRDIKIENVLISNDQTFKVCDFGSVCGVIRPPKNSHEFNYVQHDIMKNTTAQYRSPEMIDLYRGYSINEKSDIWALGVFLYKLCYYTTPFEKVGESAILHSRFQFPAFPQYSDKLKNLIGVLLSENPIKRPNICQVLEEVSRIRGVPCPLQNFYLLRNIQQQQQQQQQQQMMPPSVESHRSLSQPRLDILQGAIDLHHATPQSQSNLRTSKTFALGANQNGYFEQKATLEQPPLRSEHTKSADPFMSIDKSSLLHEKAPNLPPISTPEQLYRSQASIDTKDIPLRSTANSALGGRGDISKIVSANPTSFQSNSLYVSSSTQTDTELPPAVPHKAPRTNSSADGLEGQTTGESRARRLGQKLKTVFTGEKRSTSPIKSRQNTGDSVKSSFATLRRGISRGSFKGDHFDSRTLKDFPQPQHPSYGNKFRVSSTESIEEEEYVPRRSHTRTSSSASIVSDLDELERDNTGAREYYRSRSPVKIAGDQDSRSSIQKRVQDLLKNSEESPVQKTAHGYGRYSGNTATELSVQLTNESRLGVPEEANNFNSSVPSPIKRDSSVVVTKLDMLPNKSGQKPSTVLKEDHVKPKRPAKPSYLKGNKVARIKEPRSNNHQRNVSDLDIEELEKDFKMRFPSAV
ncbi:LADA_0E10946g1_1 [Lachancea dasiensis]|uniref:non-specific serine/threonine protein kinase n=1 Tax=Lachancea dasiensis TaxID=1072105 RepID=A0A1G4JEX2_9SACH|nr:LADA_0E10946g1_1 [Lachancea dasiensis]